MGSLRKPECSVAARSLTNRRLDELGLYKRSKTKHEPTQAKIDTLCFYSKLSVNFQGLLEDGWTTLDWLDDCSIAEIEHQLESIKESNPTVYLRAINRTTGRLMDFA